MLLEELAKRHRTAPAYDWPAYYRWYFQKLEHQDFEQLGSWFCEHCLRVNRIDKAAKYGKCPGCQTIRPRFGQKSKGAVNLA